MKMTRLTIVRPPNGAKPSRSDVTSQWLPQEHVALTKADTLADTNTVLVDTFDVPTQDPDQLAAWLNVHAASPNHARSLGVKPHVPSVAP